MWRMITMIAAMQAILLGWTVPAAAAGNCPAELDFVKRTLVGDKEVDLCKEYLGKVVLVVNTASKCGFTPQFEGLEALHRKYQGRGLVVLGFPSNDFGGQDPGTAKEIQEFCKNTYAVEFQMFEKTNAAERNADPLYKTLGRISGEFPQWNFHKYLIGRDGKLIASFRSTEDPQSAAVLRAIEEVL